MGYRYKVVVQFYKDKQGHQYQLERWSPEPIGPITSEKDYETPWTDRYPEIFESIISSVVLVEEPGHELRQQNEQAEEDDSQVD